MLSPAPTCVAPHLQGWHLEILLVRTLYLPRSCRLRQPSCACIYPQGLLLCSPRLPSTRQDRAPCFRRLSYHTFSHLLVVWTARPKPIGPRAKDSDSHVTMGSSSDESSSSDGDLRSLPRVADRLTLPVYLAVLAGGAERFAYYAVTTPWRTSVRPRWPVSCPVPLTSCCRKLHAECTQRPRRARGPGSWPVDRHQRLQRVPLLHLSHAHALCSAIRPLAREVQDASAQPDVSALQTTGTPSSFGKPFVADAAPL